MAEHLHVGRAADEFGIAESAVSRIKEFEQALGFRLLNRGRRELGRISIGYVASAALSGAVPAAL